MNAVNEASAQLIKQWLDKCEREGILPWKWDFKLESVAGNNKNVLDIQNESDPIQRIFMWYRLPKKESPETEQTELAKAIYTVAFGVDRKQLGIGFSMDVMNSFWTTYQWAILKRYGISFVKSIEFGNEHDTSDPADHSLRNEYSDYSAVNDLFKPFAAAEHTIGNFVLVSRGFNNGRGNYDYWDLGMWLIKTFLDYVESSAWEGYVDKLFLQPFVTDTYEVAEFWEDHFDESESIKPDGGEDKQKTSQLISQWLNHTYLSIEERGKFITKTLCETLGEKDYQFYKTHLETLSFTPKFANELWPDFKKK
ncbi:hypothetical protein [Schleiferilactobacillus perolens]|nr:hypothetical protein [Schleiferilactobacillus perolens]MCI2169974.1 hypothetical protein [Schleiferilactobacillus perolens]